MILDTLENADRYLSLHKGFERAVEFLLRTDLKGLPEGRYDIDGRRVFAMASSGPGRGRQDAQLEVHKVVVKIEVEDKEVV